MEAPINPDITCAFREAFLDNFSVYKNPYLTSVTWTLNVQNWKVKATGSQWLSYAKNINLQNFSIFVRWLKINAYSWNAVQYLVRWLRWTTSACNFYVNESGANRKLRFYRTSNPITSNADIVAWETYNVWVTVAGNVYTLYINWEVDKTQTISETAYTMNILHLLFSWTSSFLNWDVEDIMFFRRALLAWEMKFLNNNSLYLSR